jgi:hypothetical protein
MSPEEAEARRFVQQICDEVYDRYAGYSLDTVVDALKQRGFSGENDEHLRRFAAPISSGERLRF